MEPSDIDNLFKNRLDEAQDTHQQEIEDAKLFVWSAVQKNLDKSKSINLYHLTAAVLLLLIGFTFIFNNALKNYNQEMVLLSNKIDLLQQKYLVQQEKLNLKNMAVKSLATELKNVEHKLSELNQERPIAQKETMVYRTDTIYQKQIEYITIISDTIPQNKDNSTLDTGDVDQFAKNKIIESEIDDAIYPSFARRNKNQKSEIIKVKFLSASRK